MASFFRGFLLVCWLGASTSLLGCSNEEPDDFGKDVEGLYGIEEWTQNTAGCDAEGASVLASQTDTKLGIRVDEFFVPFLVVATCTDADDCASSTSGSVFSALGGAATLERESGSGYDTEGTVSWSTGPDGCTGTLGLARLDKQSGGHVRFETRRYDFENVSPDTTADDGSPDCSADNLRKVAKANGCVQLDVITAVKEGPIPPKPTN